MVGSSEGGPDGDGGCCGVGDTSPGTIVWVRRRNGSWWPGRILGQDELPPSQVMSPRSGTPVKLLGREDASVDWYNLEKSKRVKAFRCGDFDACIEKAETTQGTLVRKREKYARREDAILHALELERKQLASKYQSQGFTPGPHGNISACAKHHKDLGSTRYKSKKGKKRNDASVPSNVKKESGHCLLHAGTKRNFSESIAPRNSINYHMGVKNQKGDFSHVRGTTSESREKNVIVKKNKSDGSDFEDSVLNSDRRRPLAQVLQTSAELPHHLNQNSDYESCLVGENNDSSLATFQSRRSRYTYMPSDSGRTHSHSDVPSLQMASAGADFETESNLQNSGTFSEEHTSSDFEKRGMEFSEREASESETEDDAELLRSANVILPLKSHVSDLYSFPVSNKFRHVDYDDNQMSYSTCMPQLNGSEEEDGSYELGVSRWHMKGKRNSRNAGKRLMEMTDGNTWLNKSAGSIKGSLHRTNGGDPKTEGMQTSSVQYLGQKFYQIKEEPMYDSDETDLVEDTCRSEVNLYQGIRYPSSLRTSRDLSRGYSYFNDYENVSSKTFPLNKDANRNECWDGSSFYKGKFISHFGGVGPMLFDVDLKVQASYQGEHVPLVCLMSRLNGKAIIGHPIQIEIVEDGSTDHLVFCGNTSLQQNTAAPPVWPTGRRNTMQRVSCLNPFGASLDRDYDGGLLYPYPDWDMKPSIRKHSASSNHQVKVDKKSTSKSRWSSAKSQKKSSKKASLSIQKVRALSVISSRKRHWSSGTSGGLIKAEGAVPLVTCVPTKVVFTRLLEAIGRPPLVVAHRARMPSL